jgi:hypothetical protein
MSPNYLGHIDLQQLAAPLGDLRKRSLDALPFKPFERRASKRVQFRKKGWVLGAKIVLH